MIISNSEVASKNLCDKQHDFRFNKLLQPRTVSGPLGLGILGHEAFEAYYNEMMQGSPVDLCKKAAHSVLHAEIVRTSTETPEDYERLQDIAYLVKLFDGYAEVYRQEPFRILAVEKEYQTPISDDIYYGLKLDLLVEFISGKYRGDFVVVDHKFVYNFKTQLDIDMDAQIPKYIKVLRDHDIIVTKGLFNQVRYRRMKAPQPSDIYQRSWLKANKEETEQIWKEQLIVAKQIVRAREDPSYVPIRTLSLLVCRSCSFQAPCKAELNGDNIDKMLAANYIKSTYGYKELASDS